MQHQSLIKYARYIQEKAGLHLIEDDFGFITYEIAPSSIHIHDLWVDPDYRFQGHGANLVEKVIQKHKENRSFLTCSVQLNTNDTTNTLKAQLHYGFFVVGGNEKEIKLAKEI